MATSLSSRGALSSPGLSRFIPTGLVGRLAGHDDVNIPRETSFRGVALFGDIAGYTPLTRRLCGAGDAGLDLLSKFLNESFSRVVSVVHRHGGEIATWAGDAFIAYWAAEDEGTQAARAAVSAALDLLEAQSEISLPEEGELFSPQLHMGLELGRLYCAQLGNHHEGQLLFGGQAVRAATAAGQRAPAGHLAVCEGAARLLGSSLRVEERGGMKLVTSFAWKNSGFCNRLPFDVDDEQLDPLVERLRPLALTSTAGRSPERWHAQLRNVSVVFVSVIGADEREPGALEKFARAHAILVEAGRDRGASSGEWAIDDKGLVFFLAFGTPNNSREDDVPRALGFAQDAGRRLAADGFDFKVGVASGMAFCGTLGSDDRSALVTIGEPMNRAARLMSACDGAVCADGSTRRLADQCARFVEREGLMLKGLNESEGAFELLALEAETGPTSTFVGRHSELQLLADHFGQVGADRQAPILWLYGSLGIGKSALLDRVLGKVRDSEVLVLDARAEYTTFHSPYAVYRNILYGLLGASPAWSQDRLRERVFRMLRDDQRPSAPLLNAILPIALPESDVTRHLTGQARVESLQRLVLDLITAVPRIAIVLEDIQWMDSSSRQLSEYIAALAKDELLVITSREPEFSNDPSWQENDRLVSIPLSPLTEGEQKELVCQELGSRDVEEEVFALLRRYATGNPLAVLESLRFFRESEQIQEEGGRYVCASVAPDSSRRSSSEFGRASWTPQGAAVSKMVATRVDRLPHEQQLTLKVASVIGSLCDAQLLSSVHPSEPSLDLVTQQLASLTEHRFLQPRGPGKFEFCHGLLREAAYELMLLSQRQSIHRQVALFKERDASAQGADYAELTHHWSRAGDVNETFRCARRAGEGALADGANHEALDFLSHCLELEPALAQPLTRLERVRIRRQLAQACAGVGDLYQSRRHAQAALELAGAARRSRGLQVTSAGFTWARQLVRATTELSAVRRDASALDLELARAFHASAEASYFLNDVTGLLVDTVFAIEYAERAPPDEIQARVYAIMSAVGFAGLRGLADDYLHRALLSAEELGDRGGVAYVHMVRALYSVGIGRWQAAADSLDRCQKEAAEVRDMRQWCNAQIIRVWSYYYRSQWTPAEQAARSLLEEAQRSNNRQQTSWALRPLALLQLRLEALDEAEKNLHRSLELMERERQSGHEDLNEWFSTWAVLGLVRLRQGDPGAARQIASHALELTRGMGRPTGHAALTGWTAAAEVGLHWLAEDPDEPEARTMCRDWAHGLQAHQSVFDSAKPSHHFYAGRLEEMVGRRRAARRHYARAAKWASRLGLRGDSFQPQAGSKTS